MKSKMFLALAGLALSSGAFAETEEPWEATAEVGIIATSGNTETTTVQAKGEVKQRSTRWHNHYILSVLFKEDKITQDDGTTVTEKTAEKYFGSAKSAYQLQRENTNLFVFGSHADDQFGAYRKYSTLAIGYGARLYESATVKLDAEIGPGYFRGEQLFEDGTTHSESGFLLRAASALKWELTETAEFNQTVSVESAEDNTRTVAESSLSTRINGSLQMKIGFNVAHDSDVAPGKEKADTTTYVNLVYKF